MPEYAEIFNVNTGANKS